MTRLTDLLDLAAGPDDPGPAHATEDLRRGHRALRAGRARLLSTAAAGVTVAGLAAYAVTSGPADPGQRRDERPTASASSSPGQGIRLVSQPLEAGPYTFGSTPEGWHVQDVNPFGVVIVPETGVSSDPDDFAGKLVVMFDRNPVSGEQVTYQGRDFWVRGDAGYTTILTRTRGDEPPGVVSVQFPDDAGWTHDLMLEFLSTVHVNDTARPGLG